MSNVTFKITDEEQLNAMARLTAEWVRQGIVFRAECFGDKIVVEFTGGY